MFAHQRREGRPARRVHLPHPRDVPLDLLDGGHAEARALVTDTVPLSALPAVFESLRQRTSQCKVMVRPD